MREFIRSEFEKTPVSTSDIFMTNPAKSRDSFIFLTLILFYYSDEDILNSTPAF